MNDLEIIHKLLLCLSTVLIIVLMLRSLNTNIRKTPTRYGARISMYDFILLWVKHLASGEPGKWPRQFTNETKFLGQLKCDALRNKQADQVTLINLLGRKKTVHMVLQTTTMDTIGLCRLYYGRRWMFLFNEPTSFDEQASLGLYDEEWRPICTDCTIDDVQRDATMARYLHDPKLREKYETEIVASQMGVI